jgi:hypothetical protein
VLLSVPLLVFTAFFAAELSASNRFVKLTALVTPNASTNSLIENSKMAVILPFNFFEA